KYNKITNKRTDNLHKQSTDLIAQYELVCVEDLDLKELIVKDNNKKFNFKLLRKSIQNSSAGKFFNFLAYKAKKNGKHFIKVERKFPSSQCCSICGRKVLKTKDLNNRYPKCPICDTQHDRDINAAINILNRGLQLFKSPLGNGLKTLREGTPQYEF
ncbi:MAG: transposase, partial [Methanobrevibacter sp.]|nr:transposase [Methanobrevibacter sp.]